MSNAVATTNGNGRLAPHQMFYQRLQAKPIQTEIRRALPEHVNPDRFSRVLYTAVQQQPKLLGYKVDDVIREAMKVAQLGLLTDPHLGEAYVIPSRDGPQARIGYRGMLKLCRQSGMVSAVQAHAVHENDEFLMSLGTDPSITHRPTFGDRGKVIGYYAAARFNDGTIDFEPMDIEAIHRIRDRSDGWKAFKAGRIKSTPWATDEGEMARKTVLRRLLKRLPLSPDLATAAAYEDARDSGERVNISDGGLDYEAPLELTAEPGADADAFERAAAGEVVEAEAVTVEPTTNAAPEATIQLIIAGKPQGYTADQIDGLAADFEAAIKAAAKHGELELNSLKSVNAPAVAALRDAGRGDAADRIMSFQAGDHF